MTTTEELPVDPVTGLTAIGLIRGLPVWPVLGAADDDDDDDVGMDLEGGKGGAKGGRKQAEPDDDADDDADQDDEQDEDSDDGKGDEDEWKPPSQDEWKKVQAALEKANAEAKRHRETARDLRGKQRAAARTAAATGDKEDVDAAAQAKAAEDAALRKLKPVAVRSAAVAALVKAKFQNPTDARLNRMVARLDMDDLDVDLDTGAVDGLDDQIADLVEDFPELFTEPARQDDDEDKDRDRDRQRRRAGRITGADRKNNRPEPKTTGEKHVRAMNERAR